MKAYKCSKCEKDKCYYSWEGVCFDCRCEEVRERFDNELEDSCRNKINCPWCYANYDIADEMGIYEEGDNSLFCQKCEANFIATTDLVKGFSIRKRGEKR